MPLLSIIIPVYNVENYLNECLNSIMDQTFKDYEIILVNNASTDGSAQICDDFASKHKNIKVIHLTVNSLPAGARNIGLENSTGKYVHFCDSDDYYTQDSFTYISDILKIESPDVVVGKFISKPEKGAFYSSDVDYDGNIFNNNDTDKIIEHFLTFEKSICTVWRFIVNRKFLLKNNLRFSEGYNYEDEEWVPKVLCLSNKFWLIEKPFYCYRPRNGGSITSTKTYVNSSKSQLMAAINLLLFLNEKKYEHVRKQYIIYRVKFLLGLFATRCDTLNENELKELAEIINSYIKSNTVLSDISRKGDLFDFTIRYGSYIGLCLYKTYIMENTLELVRGKEDKKIFVFPTGYNGEGTARILKNAGYDIKGFLDNSDNKNGCIIDGLIVTLPQELRKLDNGELDNIFVLITTQKEQVAEILKEQLRSMEIKDSQFKIRIY